MRIALEAAPQRRPVSLTIPRGLRRRRQYMSPATKANAAAASTSLTERILPVRAHVRASAVARNRSPALPVPSP
jgi:hypothetical protein